MEAVLFLYLKGLRGVQRILDQGSLRIQTVLPGTRAQKTGLDGASDAVSQASTLPDDRAPHVLHRVSAGQLRNPVGPLLDGG